MKIYTLNELKQVFEQAMNDWHSSVEIAGVSYMYGNSLRRFEPHVFQQAFTEWLDEQGIVEYEEGFAYQHDINSYTRGM